MARTHRILTFNRRTNISQLTASTRPGTTWTSMVVVPPRKTWRSFHTAIASLWHWTQREDVTPKNLSIGYWQVSRVYCLIKQPNNARRYGLLALEYAKDLSPFLKGYAYETLARAEMIANNRVIMKVYLEKAREILAQINDEEDRQALAKDLDALK